MAVSGVMSGIGGLFVRSDGPSLGDIFAFGLNPGTWLRGWVYAFGVLGVFFGAGTTYSTIVQAAFAFLDIAWPRTQASGLEYGAVIYRRLVGTGYAFPAPLRGTATFVPTFPFPRSHAVAGIHTHPASPNSLNFSDGDRLWSLDNSIPLYVVSNNALIEFCAARWARNRTCNCFVGVNAQGDRIWGCPCVYPNTNVRVGERRNLTRPTN